MEENDANQVWNHYLLGHFKHCAKLMEMGNLKSLPEDFFSTLIRIQMGDKISQFSRPLEPSKTSLPASKSLALYYKMIYENEANQRAQVIQNVKNLSQTPDLTTRFICACTLSQAGEYKFALELCENNSIELIALKMYILFKLGKFNSYPGPELHIDDEEPLGKMAIAWNCIAQGNYKEAYHLFEDIQSSYPDPEEFQSSIILNGKAVTLMQQNSWQDAIKELEKSLLLDPQDPDTLSNLICCHRNISNDEEADRYYSILESCSESHPLIRKSQELKDLFSIS